MPNTTRSRPFRVALVFVLLAALLHFSFLGLDPLEWKLQSLELFSAELSYEVCPLFVWCGLRCFIMDIMIVLVCVSDLCWLGYKWRILLSFWVWSIIRQMILPKVVDLVGIVWTNSSYYSMRVPVVGFVSRRLLATVHAWWWLSLILFSLSILHHRWHFEKMRCLPWTINMVPIFISMCHVTKSSWHTKDMVGVRWLQCQHFLHGQLAGSCHISPKIYPPITWQANLSQW